MSIKVDLKVFLFAILFYFTRQVEIYAFLMVFAFFHEMGHLICGLILGFKPSSMKINPFGFQICFKTYPKENEQPMKQKNKNCLKKMFIAFSGPLINLMIVLICLWIPEENFVLISTIIYANLLLAIFNLLPIYPLDGGRILQEIVHMLKGKKKASKITRDVSNATVILLTIITAIVILYVHNIAFLVILAYLWYLTIKNEKEYQIKRRIEESL